MAQGLSFRGEEEKLPVLLDKTAQARFLPQSQPLELVYNEVIGLVATNLLNGALVFKIGGFT